MATRILIADNLGRVLACLDGHHGEAHAAAWTAEVLAQFKAKGHMPIAVELHPEVGGDGFRREVLEQSGRLRLELHERPDGKLELTGLSRRDRATSKRAGVATPTNIRGGLRLLAAPVSVHGERHSIRIPRGRRNPAPGQPRTPEEARHARRQARAQKRATR